MRALVLNAAEWRTKDDVYDAFFAAVGAPAWHGRNLDALSDSICSGSINSVEVPYRIAIEHAADASGEAAEFLEVFTALIKDLGSKGCPVEIELRK